MTTNDSLPQFSIYFNFNSLRHHPQYTIVSETHLDTQSYVCLCSNPRGEWEIVILSALQKNKLLLRVLNNLYLRTHTHTCVAFFRSQGMQIHAHTLTLPNGIANKCQFHCGKTCCYICTRRSAWKSETLEWMSECVCFFYFVKIW